MSEYQEPQQVKHYQVNGKYRVKLEKAAGVKTGDGFTVEANSDSIEDVISEAKTLYEYAQSMTKCSIPEAPAAVK